MLLMKSLEKYPVSRAYLRPLSSTEKDLFLSTIIAGFPFLPEMVETDITPPPALSVVCPVLVRGPGTGKFQLQINQRDVHSKLIITGSG